MTAQRLNRLTTGDILKWWGIFLLLLIPFYFMIAYSTENQYMIAGFNVSLFFPYYLPIFVVLLLHKQKTILEYDNNTISVIGIRLFIPYTIIRFKIDSISNISFYGKKTIYVYIEGFGGKLCAFKAKYNDEVCCFLSGLGKQQKWGGKAKKFKYKQMTRLIIFSAILLSWPYYDLLYHHINILPSWAHYESLHHYTSEIANKFIELSPF